MLEEQICSALDQACNSADVGARSLKQPNDGTWPLVQDQFRSDSDRPRS